MRTTPLSQYADVMCLTIFRITKDTETERLISWLRQANALVPKPPKPYFPKPHHFEYITTSDGPWKGFWLDAANMFHNLPVPSAARDLFPLEVVEFSLLDNEIRNHLHRHYPDYTKDGQLFRPMQATTPMGFACLVVLAHECMRSFNERTYKQLAEECPGLSKQLQFLSDRDAPFEVTPSKPLVMLILDDEAMLACGWTIAMVLEFYTTCVVLKTKGINGLHRHANIVDQVITTGSGRYHRAPVHRTSHLSRSDTIRLGKDKWSKISAVTKSMCPEQALSYVACRMLCGRLSSMAAIRRGLLAAFRRVYCDLRQVEKESTRCPAVSSNLAFTLSRELILEVKDISATLHFASVNANSPVQSIAVEFDISISVGVVKYARVSDEIPKICGQ